MNTSIPMAFTALATSFRPAPALACAVCFGGPQEPMTQGMSLGILTLLGVVGAVLSAFAIFFVYLGKKSARASSRAEGPEEVV